MTSITIYHDPSDSNAQVTKEESTLTGYAALDQFFIRALSRVRCREFELELNASLPEPLPIEAEDMVQVLDEMLKAITRIPELASCDDLWARLIIREQGDTMRMECHTTEGIEHDTSFIAKFVGIVFELGGTADLNGDGEVQVLWAEFTSLGEKKDFC